jgi:hypothetical protein
MKATSSPLGKFLVTAGSLNATVLSGMNSAIETFPANPPAPAVHPAPPLPATRSGAAAASWVARVLVFGSTCILVGVLWDISWHKTIGRDTFWTPAHLAIYLGGLLGGLVSGALILWTTFLGTAAEHGSTVRIWGFRGPLGAWVCTWGALAMLTSAPFDNWWHDAYGLDVKILSPPHTVLALGMFAIVIGALLLVLREQNLGGTVANPPGRHLLVYAGGLILAMVAVFLTELSLPNQQRTHLFYLVSAASYPLYLVAVGRAARHRWACTLAALVYVGINAALLWILPLFPAQPGLGPVYNPVTHFVPHAFPLLLFVPAFGLDLLRRGIGQGRGWLRDWAYCLAGALVFTALFGLTQWYFSEFLLSPGARNAWFGADRHWAYADRPGAYWFQFWSADSPRNFPPATAKTFWLAALIAFGTARIGLWLGNGMTRVRR